MRTRLAEVLEGTFGVPGWLVPVPEVMYSLAMLASYLVLQRNAGRDDRLTTQHATGAYLWCLFGIFVGARAFYVLQHPGDVLTDPAAQLSVRGGTASWGAYAGGALALAVYCRYKRLNAFRYADLGATSVGVAIAIGRWACFLNGDDFGTITTIPWAVRFPAGSEAFAQQAHAGLISPTEELSLPIHPVQLYLSASGLMLFGFTQWCWIRLKDRPGLTLWLFWLAHSISRFLLEYFRGDHRHFILGLPSSQALSLIVGLGALVGIAHVLRRPAPGYAEVVVKDLSMPLQADAEAQERAGAPDSGDGEGPASRAHRTNIRRQQVRP